MTARSTPPLGPSHERLIELLRKINDDNGSRSFREIGRKMPLAHSRVSALLHGKALPVDEQQLERLVRSGLGGSETDAAEAVRLFRQVPREQLGTAWVMVSPEGRGYFTRHAAAQRNAGQGGDLFRGRERALATVNDWLCSAAPPGRPLVVTGQPGAGKSAVVARAAVNLERNGVGPGLAMHARGATHTDVLAAIVTLIGRRGPTNRHALVEAVRHLAGTRVWPIVIDALDETHSREDRDEIARTLTDLAALPNVRVVVATRPMTAGNRFVANALLPTLMITSPQNVGLVDLDHEDYFDAAELRELTAAMLAQEGALHPGPPHHAWERYRADDRVRLALADVIARRAGKSYLVAAMAAYPLSVGTVFLDPAEAGFAADDIPASVGEALTKYLYTLTDRDRAQVRGLLIALAHARGAGVPDGIWLAFARALGYDATISDLDMLRDSTVADYLVQSSAGPGDQPVTRLFHDALVRELREPRRDRTTSDERAVLATLLPGSPSSWDDTHPYVRDHAAEHALACGALERLLGIPEYLGVADLYRLVPVLPATEDPQTNSVIAVLRRAYGSAQDLPPQRRLALLALTAAHLGLPAVHAALAATVAAPFVPQWAHGLGAPYQQLTGHTGAVNHVAVGRYEEQYIAVSGGADGTIRVWDEHGRAVGTPLAGPAGGIAAVAIGELDGSHVIAAASLSGAVRFWGRHGQPTDLDLTMSGGARLLGLATYRDQCVLVIATPDGELRLHDLRGAVVADTRRPGGVAATVVAVGRLGRREVVVHAGRDRIIRLWDPQRGTDEPLPATGDRAVLAIAAGRLGAADVIAFADVDGAVHIRDEQGRPVIAPLVGRDTLVDMVFLGRMGDRDVLVSADYGGTLSIWDEHGAAVGTPLTGHERGIQAATIGRLGSRDVVATAGVDGTVGIVEDSSRAIGTPLTGHVGGVSAFALGVLAGEEVAVSGGTDGTIRVWDEHGRPAGPPLVGHDSVVSAIAVGRFAGRDVIVSAGYDGTVRVWDARGEPVGAPLRAPEIWANAVAVGSLGSRSVIVSTSSDGVIAMWDDQRTPISLTAAEDHWASIVTLGSLGGRDVLVSAGNDGQIHLWDELGRRVVPPLQSEHGDVKALALGRLAGRDVLATAGADDTVRLWDERGAPAGTPFTVPGAAALALGHSGGRDVIAATGQDHTVLVHYPATSERHLIDTLQRPTAVAVASNGLIYAATGSALCAWQPAASAQPNRRSPRRRPHRPAPPR